MRNRLSVFVVFLAVVGTSLLWKPVAPKRSKTIVQTLQIPYRDAQSYAPVIRVKLTPSPVASVTIAIDGPYQIIPVDGRRVLATGKSLPTETVAAATNGIQIGGNTHLLSRLELRPLAAPAIWINGRKYRGNVRLYRHPDRKLTAINVLPVDEYLASVIDSEMPADFPVAARRAQAIVARTYALDQMQSAPADSRFDVYATSRSQQYLGLKYRSKSGRLLAGESESSRKIAGETAGVVCTYRGKLFRTYYSAVCGGKTINGRAVFTDAAPPLQGTVCEWCKASSLYRWKSQLPRQVAETSLRKYFAANGRQFGQLVSLTKLTAAGSDGIPEFEARDTRQSLRISAATLRRQLPDRTLHSPFFDVRNLPGKLLFEGRGHGHGVGMCQWGARGLALAGKNCIELIHFYYRDAKVVILQNR